MNVILIDSFHPHPVYHHLKDVVMFNGIAVDVTRCGKRSSPWSSAWLREDRASRFARPCVKCYGPEDERS